MIDPFGTLAEEEVHVPFAPMPPLSRCRSLTSGSPGGNGDLNASAEIPSLAPYINSHRIRERVAGRQLAAVKTLLEPFDALR